MQTIRAAAVAGSFYPSNAQKLSQQISKMMECSSNQSFRPLKALIVPHAGYQYSGQVAAEAYSAIVASQQPVERFVLLGPCHRVWTKGIVLPTKEGFETPLGVVNLDQDSLKTISTMPTVTFSDIAHLQEHSLEVQLPFIKTLFPDSSITPILVGDASISAVAAVIEYSWSLPNTVIIVSSDLSHFLDYDSANRLDEQTTHLILKKQYQMLDHDRACGCTAIQGLLAVIQKKSNQIELLAQCNSGDTAGDRSKVVGYAAYAIY